MGAASVRSVTIPSFFLTVLVVAITLLACVPGLCASVPLDRTTPRQALATFMASTDEKVKDFNTASRLLQDVGISTQEEIERARHLRDIIRGRGFHIHLDAVPNRADYIDSSTQRAEFRPYPKEPRISLIRDGENWVFAAYTVQTVPEMYEALYPFGLEFIAAMTPDDGARILGLLPWQWLAIVILAFVSLVLVRVLQPVGAWLVRWSFRRLKLIESDADVYRRIGRSLALLATTILIATLLPALRLPIGISRYAVLIVNVLLPVFAIITAYRLVDAVVEHIAWKTSKGRESQSPMRPLVRRALKLIVVVVGLVAILQQFDVNLTAVVAGLSIGGVAIALASQDTIRNLLGAVMIMTDKPFVTGDHIIVPGAEGVVEDIGLRSTRIRSAANSIIYVPNGRLADMIIDNLGLRVMRQYKITLNLALNTDPDHLQRFINGLNTIVMEHPHTVKAPDTTTIAFSDFGDFSLKILFQCYFEPKAPDEQRDRMEINFAIQRLAAELGVSFAVAPHTVIQAGNPI